MLAALVFSRLKEELRASHRIEPYYVYICSATEATQKFKSSSSALTTLKHFAQFLVFGKTTKMRIIIGIDRTVIYNFSFLHFEHRIATKSYNVALSAN